MKTAITLNVRQQQRLEAALHVGNREDCWPWRGSMFRNGYGRFRLDGREFVAHRLVYELMRGPVSPEFVMDHLCRNPACVNPWHLEPVTPRENTMRGEGPTAQNATKTHCSNGHQLAPANTRLRRGRRECLTCIKAERVRTREQRTAYLREWKRRRREQRRRREP